MATALGFSLAALQMPSCQFPDYRVLPAGGGGSDASDGGEDTLGGGSPGEAGRGGEAGGGSNGVPLCDEGLSCEPLVPSRWLGPVAYWQGPSGTEPPDCPDGYELPTDLHADPVGAPAECPCTCTSSAQKCELTENVTLYGDLGCKNECAHAVALACTPMDSCSGSDISIEAPVKEPVGTCTAKVEPRRGPVEWERDARFCKLASDAEPCTEDRACFPTPLDPFTSQLCVFRVLLPGQAPPECPDGYPNGPELLYALWDDQRGCGECKCSGPNGGKCEGVVTLGSSSTCKEFETYTLGSGCKKIPRPSHLAVSYTMSAGACSVGTEPSPTGRVVPSGSYHALCCR